MDRKTQDLAWSCLPREFREEVKKEYRKGYVCEILAMLITLFGHHNLTSDAEGEEEMLYVNRKQIDALQDEIFKAIMDAHDADDWQDAAHYILDVMPRSFAALFGSKCLSDEVGNEDNFATKEPNPAGPEEKTSEKRVENEQERVENKQSRNLSQEIANCDKHFDNILKDSFSKERRMNIAAQIMAAMISNPSVFHHGLNAEDEDFIIYGSLEFADTLIAECEKGGDNENN